MLEILRKSVSGIFGLLLIGLLVVAFGVWGIGDTFTGGGGGAVAKVGGRNISAQEYALRLGQQIRRLTGQLGGIAPDQAQTLQINQRVLEAMVTTETLNNITDDLGLAVSNGTIAEQIRQDEAFFGASGAFDSAVFRQVLRNNGLSERLFVKDRRELKIRGQFLDNIFNNFVLPPAIAARLYNYYLERRVAEYILIDMSASGEIGEPGDDELVAFYANSQLRYTQPERRTASILTVSPQRFAETLAISEEDLRAEYERAQASFSTPEKRSIDQLVLADDAVIAQVRELLNGTATFAEIVAAAGQSLDNTDLGEIERGELISEDLANRAFSMRSGEISEIIEGPLGSVVLRVRSITPARLTPFEQVEARIRERLTLEQAIEDLNAFVNTVEDERAGGATLEEIATRYDLEIIRLTNIDREGNTEDSEARKAMQNFDSIEDTIFTAAINEDLPFAETEEGAYYWVRLDEITPPQTRALGDIHAQVKRDWQDAQRRDMLEALATELVERGNAGSTIREFARQMQTRTQRSGALNRGDQNELFSPDAVQKLFATQSGKFTWARVNFGNDVLVMRVARVLRPPKQNRDAQQQVFELERRKYRDDIALQFIESLKQNYGVSVNERNLTRAATLYR